ncbi:DoxX-like family protein [Bacillus sp. JJ722]|uniref:DoxX-like family protein n=1 Tax=Bacillus sp. JJ722 TaxID=3122973 RepID=UPI002FFF4A92
MKKSKPIYVQINMDTTMDELWNASQNPVLHTEWDIRFTEISYLKKEDDEPQRFLYKTKIGFGIEIAGEGESVGQIEKESGERVSSLKFWTDHPLSLIRTGRGYWKYTEEGKHISFETLYDYDCSFGRVGKLIDTYCFRPLLGWATAWSFDSLRLWLEKGYHPKLLFRKTLTYWMVCVILAFVWIYQGLVPKVIVAHPEEIKMLTSVLSFHLSGEFAIRMIGFLEMIFGLLWLMPLRKKKLFLAHMVIIVLLTLAAFMSNPASFVHPFNPVALNGVLLFVSLVGYWNSDHLPLARNCRRRRKG